MGSQIILITWTHNGSLVIGTVLCSDARDVMPLLATLGSTTVFSGNTVYAVAYIPVDSQDQTQLWNVGSLSGTILTETKLDTKLAEQRFD
ncbi:hypothetical protein HK096_001930, partial [Nowakowskiella sp. JEL0078]